MPLPSSTPRSSICSSSTSSSRVRTILFISQRSYVCVSSICVCPVSGRILMFVVVWSSSSSCTKFNVSVSPHRVLLPVPIVVSSCLHIYTPAVRIVCGIISASFYPSNPQFPCLPSRYLCVYVVQSRSMSVVCVSIRCLHQSSLYSDSVSFLTQQTRVTDAARACGFEKERVSSENVAKTNGTERCGTEGRWCRSGQLRTLPIL